MAIQIRRGLDGGWENNYGDVIVGEPVITTDTERFFVGTGTGTYAEFANVTLLAPPYNSSMNYKEHDFVTYHGKMYICLEDTSGAWDSSKWEVTDINRAVVDGMYTNFESRTVSGSIVDISDGAGNVPVIDVATEIVAVQSGSGDPSPDNVRPITGFNTGNIIVSPTENQVDGTTYIVAWHSEAGTVYGGEVDVTKGKLTVTHWGETFDGSEGGWSWYGNYFQVSHSLSRNAKYDANKVFYMCDRLNPVTNNARSTNLHNYATLISSGAGVAFSTPALTEADALTWLSNHPVTFVYELATPVEYDITPVDAIKTLLGQNYIWSNTGDITVEYRITNQNVSELRSVISTPSLERQVEPNDRPIEDILLDTLERDVNITPSVLDVEPMEREDLTEEPIEDEPIDEPTEEQDEPLEETEDEPVEELAEENEVEDGITD